MSEKPPATSEAVPQETPGVLKFKEGDKVEDVFFGNPRIVNDKKRGKTFRVYISSARNRKIFKLESGMPSPFEHYAVQIIKDTKPEDPMSGEYLVRIIDKKEYQRKILVEGAELDLKNKNYAALVEKLKKMKEVLGIKSQPETRIENMEGHDAVEFLGRLANALDINYGAGTSSGIDYMFNQEKNAVTLQLKNKRSFLEKNGLVDVLSDNFSKNFKAPGGEIEIGLESLIDHLLGKRVISIVSEKGYYLLIL